MVKSALIFVLLILLIKNSKPLLFNKALLASSTVQLPEADFALTRSVTAGAMTAIEECTHQFRNDLWSCPKNAFMKGGVGDPHNFKNNSPTLLFNNEDPTIVINDSKAKVRRRVGGNQDDQRTASNRETAFVHAIVSAGITHTLTRNCSRGDFSDCVCDTRYTRPEIGWKQRGCSDNIHFGAQVAQQFLDASESGTSSISMANLHNNEAGRIAVKRNMRELCKCHGVSGSCATKTCWRQISTFRDVGNYLKRMYKQALRIDLAKVELSESDNLISNRLGRLSKSRKHKRNSNSALVQKLKRRRLVFLEDSPDYCRSNSTVGFPGIIGRTVASDPAENPDSYMRTSSKSTRERLRNFKAICVKQCGLKIKRRILDVWTSCKCAFKWCCKVECETCRKQTVQLTCTT